MPGWHQYIVFFATFSSELTRLHFKPSLLPTLAALAVFLLFLRLGFWQLERADEKLALETAYRNNVNADPVDLLQATQRRGQADWMHWRRCRVNGVYDPQAVLLLDNQVYRGTVGYQVFTRFVLEDDVSVLVDRGWVAAPDSRNTAPRLPVPQGPVILEGVAKPVPVAGIKLGQNVPEQLTGNLARVQRIELAQIAAQNDWELLPYVLRLDPDATGALTWNGTEPGFNRERHLGYAFQWFALAVALAVIYLVVNVKREVRD